MSVVSAGTPSVSVVIPVYNGADMVADAIASALSQSVVAKEVIVIDDGSTDGTKDVLRGLESEVVRVITKPWGGEASARNAGIEQATGEFVAFLDHDDTWVPDKLERQLATFDPGWAMSFTAHERREPSDSSIVRYDDWDPEPRAVVRLLERSSVVGPPSTVLIRLRTLRAVGLFETVSPFGTDWLQWLRIAAAGHRIGYVPDALTVYGWHGGNISADERGYYDAACGVFDLFGDRRLRARWRLLAAIDAHEHGDRRRARRRILEGARIQPRAIRPGWARYLA